MQIDNEKVHVTGIGIGPANLSLAALLQPCRDIKSRFLERKDEFQWHPGLLLPNAELQVAFLKDLVSLVDPTSKYSFLSFLRERNRLYSFINANFRQVLRREFNEYYRWVCSQMAGLEFGCEVRDVDIDRNGIAISTSRGVARTQHLVIGTGLEPNIPKCSEALLGETVFHASRYLSSEAAKAGRRIAVIGGGQTGAEVFLDLISNDSALPAEVLWFSRRANFLPLDESPFTNDQFTPNYSDFFFDLPVDVRARLVSEQKLTSDGISSALLGTIYRRLYELKYLSERPCSLQLRPGRTLEGMSGNANGLRVATRQILTGAFEYSTVDLVILCTGYTAKLPPCLDSVKGCIKFSPRGGYAIKPDFSIESAAHPTSRIYVQNAARVQRGLADPNLSLLAWRSAKIVNSLAARVVYEVDKDETMIDWENASSSKHDQRQMASLLQFN